MGKKGKILEILLGAALLFWSCDNSGDEAAEIDPYFTSVEAMGDWLASQPENSAENPYQVGLSGIDLSERSGLKRIFGQFHGRYVDLDLAESRGSSIPDPGTGERPGEAFLTGIILPAETEHIGAYAFAYCVSLKKVRLPGGLKTIGEYAFADCVRLTSLTLPNSVESVGAYLFKGCTSLASVTLSANLSNMGDGVFEDCAALTECRVNAENPPNPGPSYPPFARAGNFQRLTLAGVPGLLNYKDHPIWGAYASQMFVEGIAAGLLGEMEIYFTDGRRRTDLDGPEPPSCTVEAGKSIVLAPIAWNVSSSGSYTWRVNSENAGTGEYFTFAPPGVGEYLVTCTVTDSGKTADAGIRVFCVNPGPVRGLTASSRANAVRCFGFSPGAGQFTGVYPALDNSANSSEEAWAQASENRLNGETIPMGPYYDGWSLSHMGYIIAGFDHSVVKRASGNEIRITGNAFGDWLEPGVVSVMQDTNGNGEPDDTWYELKGSFHNTSNAWSRYAITYFRPGSATAGTTYWVDNKGRAGSANGPYPFFTPGAYITYSGTALGTNAGAAGYADTNTQTFSIADAVQADGTQADLSHIDFVRIHSGAGGGGLGGFSTELSGIEDNTMTPPPVLAGAVSGGQYSYVFQNNSGYVLTIKVWQVGSTGVITGSDPIEIFTLNAGASASRTYTYNRTAVEYSGGNVRISVSDSTAVFTELGGSGI
ncbi:MAG: leucine-rich repeat domain-containing protein [Spirochaetaceae bacterium]|nr:leucine-rich repeat domain-containing protein [Spirochaetaceae bacterium]